MQAARCGRCARVIVSHKQCDIPQYGPGTTRRRIETMRRATLSLETWDQSCWRRDGQNGDAHSHANKALSQIAGLIGGYGLSAVGMPVPWAYGAYQFGMFNALTSIYDDVGAEQECWGKVPAGIDGDLGTVDTINSV